LTADSAVVVFQRIPFNMRVKEDLRVLVLDDNRIVITDLYKCQLLNHLGLAEGRPMYLGCSKAVHFPRVSPGMRDS